MHLRNSNKDESGENDSTPFYISAEISCDECGFGPPFGRKTVTKKSQDMTPNPKPTMWRKSES